jgi:shikimate dehydrogenase
MTDLINKTKIEIKGKKVIILGTGGTSKTSLAVTKSLGASEIYLVSRSARDGAISYEEAYGKHSDAQIIINTTPVGMFPKADELSVDTDRFPSLEGAIDAIYNPLRTRFVQKAMAKGAEADGGLYMLVAQGVRASEIFLGTSYSEGTVDELYGRVLKSKENVVLAGMPGCGKSTIGRLVAENLGRPFIDLDDEIVKMAGKTITEIFAEGGESLFRDIETEAVRRVATISGAVIATGGGAILRDENVGMLKQNGRIYFLDRPIEQLMPTADRPLASSAEAIMKRYNERFTRYCAVCDVHLKTDGVAEHAAEDIGKDFV